MMKRSRRRCRTVTGSARLVGVAAGLLLGGCSSSEKLDEAVVFERPEMALKIVHYHENLPLHYSGDRYRVMCRSAATEAVYARAHTEPGWRPLGELVHGNEGLPAEAFVDAVRGDYQVFGDGLLAWSAIAFNVTWDACGRIASWDPSRLPAALIDSVARPDYCRPKGSGDCRFHDFQNERRPRYRIRAIDSPGHADVSVSTPALVTAMRVSTGNAGRVWHVGLDPGPRGSDSVASLQQIDVAQIDSRLPSMSLRQWLDSALPPGARAMVVWSPDRVDCGSRNGAEPDAMLPSCVELFVTNRWGDEARLSLWHSPGGYAWQSGRVSRDGSIVPVEDLSGLPAALAGSRAGAPAG